MSRFFIISSEKVVLDLDDISRFYMSGKDEITIIFKGGANAARDLIVTFETNEMAVKAFERLASYCNVMGA